MKKESTKPKSIKKGIPYKSIDARQTTSVIIRLTESQKNIIRNNAIKNNQTVSEFIRQKIGIK